MFTIIGSSLLSPPNASQVIEDGTLEEFKYSTFEQNPVDVEKFLYGENHLNLNIRLSQPQLDLVDNLSNIFEKPLFTEGVLMAGQGSGKDTCSIFINLRIIYLLHCLRSPQRFFGMDSNSFIDSINVAPNADLAKNIYFMTLLNVLKDAPLFQPTTPFYIETKATANVVNFPKNIRLISGNSENESWQGYTPILIVLDEIDAFKSELELRRSRGLRSQGAEGIYDTARTLVQSRFPGVGKIISLSWPRFKGSFIDKRFAAGKNEARTYVSCKPDGDPYATWDFNPSKKQEDFADFYEVDPILAKARFECDPPYARDAFIKDPLPVLRAFDAEFNEADEIVWAGLKAHREAASLDKQHKYFIHVDLGLRHSNAALAIGHKEDNIVVLDLIKAWIPEPDKEVSFKDIEKFIIDLKEDGYRIGSVTYDNYQSVSSLQELQRRGITAKYKSVNRTREAYDTLKDLIYQERIDAYFDKDTIEELIGLDVVYGDRVDARPGMKKDRADAVAGAVHGVLKEPGIITGMKELGSLTSLYMNQQVLDQEEENKNTRTYDIRKDLGLQTMKDRVVGSPSDTCGICSKVGGIEYAMGQNRVLDSSIADRRLCIICGTKWKKDLNDDSWLMVKEPDHELMRDL